MPGAEPAIGAHANKMILEEIRLQQEASVASLAYIAMYANISANLLKEHFMLADEFFVYMREMLHWLPVFSALQVDRSHQWLSCHTVRVCVGGGFYLTQRIMRRKSS